MIHKPHWHDDADLTGNMALAALGFAVIVAIGCLSVVCVLMSAIWGAGK